MKTKIVILSLFILQNFLAFSEKSVFTVSSDDFFKLPGQLLINSSDSVIFDLANATITATFIDLPLYVKSDDAINGIDYEMNFNLSKLTYSVTIDLLPLNTTIMSSAFYNPNDLFLRYTGSAIQSFPNSGNVYISKIRFALSAPCTSISSSDFSNITTLLNGHACSFRVSNLNFSDYFPTGHIKNTAPCLNTLLQFTDSSFVLKGDIVSWNWNFGNGTASSLQNNLTSYTATGNSTVSLVVTGSAGCKDTLVKTLVVSLLPSSSFTYTFDCVKDSVFFTNTSSISSGSIASSFWHFGDLSPVTNLSNPRHHYNTGGVIKVKLISTSNTGCTSTIIAPVSIRPADINLDGVTDVDDFLIFAPAYDMVCN